MGDVKGGGGEVERTAGAQFNVRLPDDVKASFQAMMERIKGAVRQTNGQELSQTALVRYWATWLAGLDVERQVEWAEAYKGAEQARIEAMEKAARKAVAGGHGGVASGMPLDQRPADEKDRPSREVKALPKVGRGKKV
jgi:hypothetical protein